MASRLYTIQIILWLHVCANLMKKSMGVHIWCAFSYMFLTCCLVQIWFDYCFATQPGATTRKSGLYVERQNSEISYYADDDEDGTHKKYTRRGGYKIFSMFCNC